MSRLPDLTGKVRIDDSDLDRAKKSVDGFAREIGQAGAAAEPLNKKLTEVGGKMTDVGKKATIGLTLPIVAGMGFAANAASDLSEAVNVTGLVFGDARGEIDAFVKTTAEGLGQSERAAREATASFGGLLTNLGFTQDEAVDASITLTTLASDLGSAFNKEPAEAVQALGAALRGETEPIRQFNVMLDDQAVREKAVALGLAETTAEVDNNAKAQATLALITEQTAAVQGDFANTSDGLANQQRILKARLEDTAAEIGTRLLPFALDAVGAVAGLVDWFSQLPAPLQASALGGAALIASVGPIAAIAGNATKAVGALIRVTQALALTQNAAAIATSGLGAALIGAATLYASYQVLNAAITDSQDKWNAAAGRSVNAAALLESGLIKDKEAFEEMAVEAYIGAGRLDGGSNVMKDAAANAERLAPQIAKATDALKWLSAESGVSAERIAALASEIGVNLGAMTDEGREKLAAAIAQIAQGVTPTQRLEQVTETLGDEFATTKEAVTAFEEALDALLGSQLSSEQAQIRVRDATRELRTALDEGARADESAAAFKDRLALATINLVGDLEDEVEAMVRNGEVTATTEGQHGALLIRLIDLQNKFPELRDEIQGYIDKLNAIPTDIETRVTVRQFGAFEVSGFGNVDFAGGRAAGGPVMAGKAYLVGEKAPELFIPSQNGRVLTAQQVAAAAGGAQFSLTVNGDVDLHTLAEAKAFTRQMMRETADVGGVRR